MLERINWDRALNSFWLFQIAGFTALIIADIFAVWGFYDFSLQTVLMFIANYSLIFILLTILRLVYRHLYRIIKRPGYYVILSVFGSLVCGFVWMEAREIVYTYFIGAREHYRFSGREHSFMASLLASMWVPLIWSTLYFGIKYWKDLVLEKQRVKDAISLAQKTQLQMLRYQLNPHFLFNSLNSIQALVHEDAEKADLMVSELSEFLRYTLEYDNRLMIKVREEAVITQKYLNIEKIRYEERLEYKILVEKEIMNFDIPCFISQPLVENSIRHGLMNDPEGIRLNFSVFTSDGSIVIEVTNNGSLSDDWKIGVGLQNVIDRLENSFPGRSKFEISLKDNLVISRIVINQNYEKI